MTYRLAIDVGTNSVGWCALRLDASGAPSGIADMGVRIFHDSRDPQSGTSLAGDRRVARGARRRRDRYLKRRDRLMTALARHGLMPSDAAARKALEGLDPYELRARALDQALTPHETGRALFHLSQRRGFKSNRIAQGGAEDEKEDGLIRAGVSELERRLQESSARTLGEYLHRRKRKKKGVRARPGIGIYPSRRMLEDEFAVIWAAQAARYPAMTDAARAEIHEAIFFQRPLHPKEPGWCELDPTDRRAPYALPLTQLFRMWQELANLRIVRPDESQAALTPGQRDILYAKLSRQKTMRFGAMHKLLGLDALERFNLESEKRKGLNGDSTAAILSSKDLFGSGWHDVEEAQQDEIVEALLAAEDENEIAALAQGRWGLDAAAADRLARVRLPQGYGRVGRKAMAAMTEIMRDQGLVYSDAAREAGYNHSDQRPETLLDALPYYGEILSRHTAGGEPDGETDERKFGRLANPTVHVGLNQLRKLHNALVAEHGKPAQVVIELARDLKIGQQKKQEIAREQAANQRNNERIAEEIARLKQPVTGENIRRYKLWEETGDVHDRRCVFTGEVISGARLFSDEIEIEHLLPFSRTLDDSQANKIVSLRRANRDKGNRSPFEAFSDDPRYDYDAILRRAEALPHNKRWRFAPDAMARLEKDSAFIARHLTDTAYLARATRDYLSHVCPDVWVTPGRLTGLLRGKWGLNSLLPDSNIASTAQEKNRLDHRHHAIDAFVIGVTDRGLLNRVARAAEGVRDRLIGDMPEPWEGFRETLREKLTAIIVSHRPDHGVEGQLHEDTAYGFATEAERDEGYTLVHGKPLAGLTEGEMARIRDPALREALLNHVALEKAAGRTVKQAQESFDWPRDGQKPRRVRLLKKEKKFIPIKDHNGNPYKALVPGENHHVDIFEKPDGGWAGEGVSVFDANQKGFKPAWRTDHPGARLVMRIHKGDLMILVHEGVEKQCRVAQLAPGNNRLVLVQHNESGNYDARAKDKNDPFKWIFGTFTRLKTMEARKVKVDMLGRLRDPGPPP